MVLGGLQKLTLLDYPGEIAATVFVNGCNFRCPFCHNASLVLPTKLAEGIDEAEFFDFLDSRRGRLSAVCVSGGEPTLYPDLPEFLSKIRERGYLIKLDTNGFYPGKLKSAIDEGLLDYIAMDIKSSKESYGRAVGIPDIDISPAEESVKLIMSSGVDYEFRTTVTERFHSVEDFEAIGKWLSGCSKYYLQNFVDSGNLIDPSIRGCDKNVMNSMLSAVKEYIPEAEFRGL